MGLTRTKPLRAQPRGRGNRGERQVCDILKAYGWTGAYRNAGSGAWGGGDIIAGPQGVHLEVKYVEVAAPWAWLRQAESEARPTDLVLVICRCNGAPWSAILLSEEWESLLQVAPGPVCDVFIPPRKRLSLWKQLAELRATAGAFTPVLKFARADSEVYACVPLEDVLVRLRIRESGL